MISLSDRPKLYVIDEVATDNIKIVDKGATTRLFIPTMLIIDIKNLIIGIFHSFFKFQNHSLR
jgi:hypothetical protein